MIVVHCDRCEVECGVLHYRLEIECSDSRFATAFSSSVEKQLCGNCAEHILGELRAGTTT